MAVELVNSKQLWLSARTEPSSIPSWMQKGPVSFPAWIHATAGQSSPTQRSPFLPLTFHSPGNLLWPKDNAKHDAYKNLQKCFTMCTATSLHSLPSGKDLAQQPDKVTLGARNACSHG